MTAPGPAVGLMLATVADTETGLIAPDRVVSAARRAEAAGFDGVYLGDHLLHPHPMLESIVTLSVVVTATERISLGPCVLLFGLRQPVVLAKQLGTLAAFAPGRLRVGVGVGGEYPAEFEAAGVPLSERGKRMEAVLREVRSLLSGGLEGGDVTLAPGAPGVPFLLAGWKEVCCAARRRTATAGSATCSGPILSATPGLPAQLPGRTRTRRRALPDRDARPGPCRRLGGRGFGRGRRLGQAHQSADDAAWPSLRGRAA